MPSSKIPRICKQCGRPFEIYPYQERNGHGIFCSLRCERFSRRQRIVLRCDNCEGGFEVIKSVIKWHNPHYCSRACWNASRTSPLLERYLKCIGPTTEDGCILWVGPTDQWGYGILTYGPTGARKVLRATHMALELAGRKLPDGQDALHRCDNPPCVNEVHLFGGSQSDNDNNMWMKNRGRYGEKHSSAILTEAAVRDCRRRFGDGNATARELAEEFNVSPATMTDVLQGRTWKRVKME